MTLAWDAAEFAAALADRNRPVPAGTSSWNMRRPAKRFGVYRGNVSGALREALAVRYPVVQRLVGDEFFQFMAWEYAQRGFPSSPVLIHFGADFPDFISRFPAADTVPYLADVAALESAHWEAYHARDCAPVASEAFAALDTSGLDRVTLEFLPSVRIVPSRFPIVDIWRMNLEGNEPQPVNLDERQDALVVRPEFQIEVRKLPHGAARFLTLIQAGKTLAEAITLVQEEAPEFDIVQNLTGIIQARLVSRIIQ